MFRYAVSNWIYDGEELADTYARLRRLGFDGVELVGEPERYSPENIRRLNQEYGLAVVSVLSWCLWPLEERDLAHPDTRKRRAAVSYIRDNVDLAAAAGAPVVVVIPAPSGRPAPHGNPGDARRWQKAAEEEWERAVESVREAARYAQEKGITLAVEPINRFESFLVNSAAQGLQFIRAVALPNVKLHLDTFHMNIEDADPVGAVERAGTDLVSMHLSDSNRRAVGCGHFDFGRLLRALKNTGFKGPLILEPVPAHPNPSVANKLEEYRSRWEADARDSLRTLKELEKNI